MKNILFITVFSFSLTSTQLGFCDAQNASPKQTEASLEIEKKAVTPPAVDQAIKKEPTPTSTEEDTTAEAPPSYENAFMKMILLLLGLIILILLTIWFIKRFSRSRITQMNHLRNIKITERRPLSPKTMLYLVEVAGKQIVISESHLEVRNITDINLSK